MFVGRFSDGTFELFYHIGKSLDCSSDLLLMFIENNYSNLCAADRFEINNRILLTSKGKFLYSAVSSPQDRSKRFTLYFPDRPVHSDTISASLGSIQPYATINARRLLIHISTIVYSQVVIYTAE